MTVEGSASRSAGKRPLGFTPDVNLGVLIKREPITVPQGTNALDTGQVVDHLRGPRQSMTPSRLSTTPPQTLIYHGSVDSFEVPLNEGKDFAPVARPFVWFLPPYNRYTEAVILHDYLCEVAVPAGRISRIDADGIFRQSMRQLGVPFLHRWIIWASVRLGALTDPAGRASWWKEAWRVAFIAALALPIVAPAGAVIGITILVFYLIELLAWVPLETTRRVRERRHRPAKLVNKPTLRLKL